jgi:hypothetical protein
VPTRVNSAQNSLFVRLGDNPFIQIEANDITEDSLHGVLDYWKGEHNAYCNFERMLNTVRPEEVQPFFSMNPKGWVDYYKETDPKFPMVQFNFGMMAARSLWTALPEHFAARPEHKEELAAFGANLNLDALPRLTKKETPSGSE